MDGFWQLMVCITVPLFFTDLSIRKMKKCSYNIQKVFENYYNSHQKFLVTSVRAKNNNIAHFSRVDQLWW